MAGSKQVSEKPARKPPTTTIVGDVGISVGVDKFSSTIPKRSRIMQNKAHAATLANLTPCAKSREDCCTKTAINRSNARTNDMDEDDDKDDDGDVTNDNDDGSEDNNDALVL